MDAAGPRSVFGVRRRLDALPDDAAAVYPGAEGDHEHPVTLAHPALGLDVGELVQQRAARHVPEPVQCHARPVADLRLKLRVWYIKVLIYNSVFGTI